MKCTQKILTGLVIFFAVMTAGCHNEIFYEIGNDVPPEAATVSGIIPSIARYTIGAEEYLFLSADKGIRYKSIAQEIEDSSKGEHTTWFSYPEDALPFSLLSYSYYSGQFSGQQILKVIADSTSLYIVSAEYGHDIDQGITYPSKFHIWAGALTKELLETPDKSIWTDVSETLNQDNKLLYIYQDSSNNLYKTDFNVFSTNSVQTAHRKAFIRSCNGDKDNDDIYYQLNGASEPEPYTISALVDSEDSTNGADSAAYIGDTIYFFDTLAVTTNETKDTAATYIYYASEKELWYYNGTDKTKALNAGYDISCITATSDALLIGRGNMSASTTTGGGIVKTSLTGGVPGEATESFTTNATSQLSSSYIVYTLINTNPLNTELNSTLYASIGFKGSGSSTSVSYSNIGLWSYYPTRGNWNRE